MDAKRRLLGMTLKELKDVASEFSLPSYASQQIANWLYKKRVKSISDMTNISASKRLLLEKVYEVVDGDITHYIPKGTVIETPEGKFHRQKKEAGQTKPGFSFFYN